MLSGCRDGSRASPIFFQQLNVKKKEHLPELEGPIPWDDGDGCDDFFLERVWYGMGWDGMSVGNNKTNCAYVFGRKKMLYTKYDIT